MIATRIFRIIDVQLGVTNQVSVVSEIINKITVILFAPVTFSASSSHSWVCFSFESRTVVSSVGRLLHVMRPRRLHADCLLLLRGEVLVNPEHAADLLRRPASDHAADDPTSHVVQKHDAKVVGEYEKLVEPLRRPDRLTEEPHILRCQLDVLVVLVRPHPWRNLCVLHPPEYVRQDLVTNIDHDGDTGFSLQDVGPFKILDERPKDGRMPGSLSSKAVDETIRDHDVLDADEIRLGNHGAYFRMWPSASIRVTYFNRSRTDAGP